ncbi:MAG: hypothetical protein J6V35_03860 [Bacteroidales bacterium]|nr:hypothetical protein [Bacteroidales bacterium]
MKKLFNLSVLFALLASFCACEEPKPGEDETNTPTQLGKGYYVLCEGSMGRNNASLDFYDIVKQSNTIDLFQSINGVGLGETANDMTETLGNLYIVVTGSNCVMSVNKRTCKKLALIPITTSENPQPRNMVTEGVYGYVSCFDGHICIINLQTNKIDKTITTQGRNPEQMAISNGKLYVACNGGLDYPNYDNKVEVYDLETLNLIKTIEAGINPGNMIAKDGYIYAQIRGNYGDVPQELIKINTQTDEIEERVTMSINSFDIAGDNIIFTNTDYSTYTTTYKTIPTNDLNATAQDFITNMPEGKSIMSPYKISHDENNIFITDAKDYASNGRCFVFDYAGNYQIDFETYTCPQKVISKK